MPHRLLKIDWQMVALNAASASALVTEAMANNTTEWAVGFLIVTIGVLNLAKAYSTIKESRRKKEEKKEK